jgi:DNA repair exonuclease SbcCD ATPase subunit
MNAARTVALAAVVAAVLAGCFEQERTVRTATPVETAPVKPSPAPAGQADYLGPATLKDETGREIPSATDSAVEWSVKYAQTSEKLLAAQRENQELMEKIRALAGQAAKLQAELDGSKKQLKDADAMLLELRTELEKWKTNVLGFREEMRAADQAQLEALHKVLRLLGGEAPRVQGSQEHPPSAAKEISSAPAE